MENKLIETEFKNGIMIIRQKNVEFKIDLTGKDIKKQDLDEIIKDLKRTCIRLRNRYGV